MAKANTQLNATLKPIILSSVLTAGVFTLDYASPLGVAGGMLYVLVVLSGYWFAGKKHFIFLAAVSSFFVVLGYYASSLGSVSWIVFTNRAYALGIIWSLAIVLTIVQNKSGQKTNTAEYLWNIKNNANIGNRAILNLMIALAAILASAFFVANYLEYKTKEDLHKTFAVTMDASVGAIRELLDGEKRTVRYWAENEQLHVAVQDIVKVEHKKSSLLASPAQNKIRKLFKFLELEDGFKGYFIISKDGINLSSSRDASLGDKNILLEHGGGLLEKVFNGETLVSLPQRSDVLLIDVNGNLVEGLATMFSAAPIRNLENNIIAVLALRIEPDKAFSKVLENSFFGETGEMYAFNKNGTFISDSRFNDDLRKIGLIAGSHTDLNIDVRDPGVDMTIGQIPKLLRDKQPLTLMAQSAIAGNKGINLDGYRDYRGVEVIGHWMWLDDLDIGIAVEIDKREAYETLSDTKFSIYIFSALSVSILIFLAFINARAQKEILKRDRQNRLILNSADEGIYGLDINGLTTFANPAACTMLGYKERDLLGKKMHITVHHSHEDGSEYPQEQCPMHKTILDGKIRNIDTEVFWHKSGEPFPVEYASNPIYDEGELVGAVITFRNITERKEAEEKINQSHIKAEIANKAKSEMLANMSHELRTPLNAIIGFSDIMMTGVYGEIENKKHLEYIEDISSSGKHLLDLISDILDVSAIESGKLNLSEENICPIETVHTSLRIVMRRAEDDGVQLIPEFDADLPMINADPRRLKQILINLLSNAIKFSHKGGAVSIKVSIGNAGGHVFTITDNGIGMNQDELEKAMSEFGQVDRHKSKKQEGTGLGIPLTKGLVELHGGTLTLTSIKGEGTVAKVVFPNSRVVGDSTTGN